MAKFQTLQIGGEKIQLNAINTFFYPTDAYNITITNDSSGPNIVFYSGGSADKYMTIYDTHGATETYSLSSIGGVTIIGGLARKK